MYCRWSRQEVEQKPCRGLEVCVAYGRLARPRTIVNARRRFMYRYWRGIVLLRGARSRRRARAPVPTRRESVRDSLALVRGVGDHFLI
jgi:hypothetical protein